MVKIYGKGVFVADGMRILASDEALFASEPEDPLLSRPDCLSLSDPECSHLPGTESGLLTNAECQIETARRRTMAWSILRNHNRAGGMERLKIRFDALASHDITYVGIVQSAKASGMTSFPVPYVLTDCHNSLCAVGGTINEDDHAFGLSAAIKYGGIHVPAHQAVIHAYMREERAGCGKMILGSDSHTRYGALGTLAIGEGGPELVRQLLGMTYEMPYPRIVAVYLEGTPVPGVGPHDVALTLIGGMEGSGLAKNAILEFIGPGVSGLSVDFRCGIDVMTTETTCLSSIWTTDAKVEDYLDLHGRHGDYARLQPGTPAYYDGLVQLDLGKVTPMIALPFHPARVCKLTDLIAYPHDMLHQVEREALRLLEGRKIPFSLTDKIENGRIRVDQGIIGGCAGGIFENVLQAAALLKGKSVGNRGFSLNVYPASQPIHMELVRKGAITDLMGAGAVVRTACCGPCFGAGDVPAHNGFSIRHATRNFPHREGSRPGDGQFSFVALMDARSIAATAVNGGLLTAATEEGISKTEVAVSEADVPYRYDRTPYERRVYAGYGKPEAGAALVCGPDIRDWPVLPALGDNLLLRIASVIRDEVTTTDELIPSGETSSYRSNPFKLAEFTLSRKDPGYVGRARSIREMEADRAVLAKNGIGSDPKENADEGEDESHIARLETGKELARLHALLKDRQADVGELEGWVRATRIGSTLFARKPGDGSAREQAASCQRVLGASANLAESYATRRYRANLVNWGILPFLLDPADAGLLEIGQYLYVHDVRTQVAESRESIPGWLVTGSGVKETTLRLGDLSEEERATILCGCLMNRYAQGS